MLMADENIEINTMDASNVTKLKVPDLKKELKSRGLSTAGNKNELVERLQAAIRNDSNESGTIESESIDDIEEDLLNDDDDDHMDERELISDLDALEEVPKVKKRKSEESELNVGQFKRVILNRNVTGLITESDNVSQKIEEDSDPIVNSSNEPQSNDDKKVVKLSELSAKERFELRAKKFGSKATTSDEALKLARAERFGKTLSDSETKSISENQAPETSIDVLKQRAARFGTSTSKVIINLENQEKLQKRKERFAIISPTIEDSVKASRLKRFNIVK